MDDAVYYRAAWSSLDEDGTLRIRVSMADDDYSTSCGYAEIAPGSEDYAFWRWVTEHGRFGTGLLDAAAVATAREEFERHSA